MAHSIRTIECTEHESFSYSVELGLLNILSGFQNYVKSRMIFMLPVEGSMSIKLIGIHHCLVSMTFTWEVLA